MGELLAVAAVVMALLFVLVDMGQPARVLNVFRYPTPASVMFWDVLALGGYLVLNIVAALSTLSTRRDEVLPPAWLRPLMVVSIPWAVSIHTVTAFLYSGLPGRPFWLTALLAPRFLASAFASGPALLILLCLIVRRRSRFDPGRDAIQQLAVIVAYAALTTVFFLLVEVFTVFYSQIPDHVAHYRVLFGGSGQFAPFAVSMWMSAALALGAIVLLLVPRYRQDERLLAAACAMVFASIWIDKGLGLIVGGFVPTLLGRITTYVPTIPEVLITLGVWAVGALTLTILYRMTVGVHEALAPLAGDSR
jgi:molybdopterin-containing oxidoreductase family membrane subunit